MIERLVETLRQTIETASTLELVVLGVVIAFSLVALQARRRRHRRQAIPKIGATRRSRRQDDGGSLTSSKEDDLYNEAFGDDFSDTGGADGGDGD